MAREAARLGKPVFRGSLEADEASAAKLKGRCVLAFAGIGRPDKFFATLRDCGAEVVRTRVFADHHAFRRVEIDELVALAERENLLPVTTEKDFARIEALGSQAAEIATLPVSLVLADAAAMRVRLASVLAKRRAEPAT